jgi:hypothetical protein
VNSFESKYSKKRYELEEHNTTTSTTPTKSVTTTECRRWWWQTCQENGEFWLWEYKWVKLHKKFFDKILCMSNACMHVCMYVCMYVWS